MEKTRVSSVHAFQSFLWCNFQNSLGYLCLNAAHGQEWHFLSFLLNPYPFGCQHHCCSSIRCQKHLSGCCEGWLLPKGWRVPMVSIRAPQSGPIPPPQPEGGQLRGTRDSLSPGHQAPPWEPAKATLQSLSILPLYPGDILSPSAISGL